MLHELTITVDDEVYQTLKPMVEEQTLDSFLHEVMQMRLGNAARGRRPVPSITALRGTLPQTDISDLRDEADRPL
jgi:predicted CopG family antitoxin